MSVPAESNLDPFVGAAPLPLRTPGEPARRLHAVEQPAPRRRPRLVYGIVAVSGALLIGGAQMGLSILTTQSSYELSTLSDQQRSLDWQKQMLQDSIAGLSSPQYLAANAEAMGMVTGQAPTYLRLSDNAVIGTAAGLTGASAVNALSKAAVGNALVSGRPLVGDPAASLGAAGGSSVVDKAIPDTPTPPAIADGLPVPATH
ncbi:MULTISPECIES: hypothetical protein [Microbacterium]|uniref:hypothetical protein n=1 Tax=Microbacterium TaxID=33882 RepID=UPI0004030A63|nr:hypothetical protein [Microbacterium sp. B24]